MYHPHGARGSSSKSARFSADRLGSGSPPPRRECDRALDPWEGSWANFAVTSGKPEHAEQLARKKAGYHTFLVNLWDHRQRVIPLRGRSPEKLYELAQLGVAPDLVYLDSDKSGVELEVCHELFPDAILCGDDWTYAWRKATRSAAR